MNDCETCMCCSCVTIILLLIFIVCMFFLPIMAMLKFIGYLFLVLGYYIIFIAIITYTFNLGTDLVIKYDDNKNEYKPIITQRNMWEIIVPILLLLTCTVIGYFIAFYLLQKWIFTLPYVAFVSFLIGFSLSCPADFDSKYNKQALRFFSAREGNFAMKVFTNSVLTLGLYYSSTMFYFNK